MFMLFTKFENYDYWHLHSSWSFEDGARGMKMRLIEADTKPKIVDYKIEAVGSDRPQEY